MPRLDPRVEKPCVVPEAKIGDSAKAYAARVTGALVACKAKHGNVVVTYNTLRKDLAGK